MSAAPLQLEDPGKLIQTGYSAGARSKPSFTWVRNIADKRDLSPEFVASSDFRTSCLFAAFWNMCRSRLPPEVMEDIIDFNEQHKLLRMDAGTRASAQTGRVSLDLGAHPIVFQDMELAPACGMLGANYSRYVLTASAATPLDRVCILRGTHNERQPHPFALSWTLHRSHGSEAGGNFYIASYGLKIEGTADTKLAWRPIDWHGTSLGDHEPDDPSPAFQQLGISFVTSSRVATIFARYSATFAQLRVQAGDLQFAKVRMSEDDAAEEAAAAFVEDLLTGICDDIELSAALLPLR